MPTFIGQVADAAVTVLEANKAAAIQEIQAAEGGAEALIASALNNLKPSGLLAVVWGTLKPAILAELLALEQANPGSVTFTIIDAEAHKLATDLGG